MHMEAEIACNPITSFHALNSSETHADKLPSKERRNRSNVLHTQTSTETHPPSKTNANPLCMFCLSISHRLHRCPNFRRTSLDERQEFVKDKRLCFGCLKPGHSAKECHHKHICDNCKGRHPTQLHDDNFCKGKPKLVSPQPDMETATTQSLHTRTEDSSIHTSMIVPVWISLSHNPVTEKLVASTCHRVAVKELPPVTPLDVIKVLESDFKDTDKSENSFSQDDILFLNIMRENISKNDQGHYEMPLPFKERPHLPNNRQLAVVRLGHLKKKLLRDEMYKEHYVKFMSEVIDRGDAEEVHQGGKEGERWYIPHHGVYHTKKPSKLRVVFDCSARYQGTSLNEHLLRGPDLMNSLIGILLRFRQHHIAVMSDVEKMFHQFHVPEPDRDYLRFLWWKNGDLTAEPSEYRMKVHLFGAASSPGCANYGLKHLAKENQD
ncbi:uncharacterized protein LOC128769885 isoform X2 [Synchiropus splendidus]|uniref:uncharacterized protein LOC128769885 isoform X2 n=1 Tax=Synchiropus splendidus TaxID=270530 RepID=UPI00237DDAA4|nr:uncharacterized protein LOC128769885 isoform X2 [Synchiropus splendidus]